MHHLRGRRHQRPAAQHQRYRHRDDLPPHERSQRAIRTEGANSFVFRVIDRKLVRTPVQVGIFNNNWEEILSGLNEKDVVALNATSNRDLLDGMTIRPVQ